MTTFLSPSRAVSITIGTSLLFLSSWQRVMPSTPGSIMSSTTTSKESTERKLFRAASPSAIAFTLIPSRSKARSMMLLIATSSSTSSILGIHLYLRQLDLDCCANPFSRTDRDVSSHPLGELPADGQPQTKAFGAVFPAVEALENVGKFGRAYPGSLVFYDDGAPSYAKPYICPPARVLYSVAEQYQKYLL